MNNKGLTLVELLGVLVVLTVIVSIVTPIVTRDLKKSRVELCEHELDSFIDASKNWFTDKIDGDYSNVYESDGNFIEQCVTVEQLYNGGYITEPNKKYINSNVGVIITKNNASYSYDIAEKTGSACKKVKISNICN